jgi:hypothetical protein
MTDAGGGTYPAPTAGGDRTSYGVHSRLLKNAHLRRYPAASPSRRRGKKSLLIRRDATLRISGVLHRGIFDQPEKNEFFNRL